MKSSALPAQAKQLPSFSSNPAFYGMPRRAQIAVKMRPFTPPAVKPTLPDGYREDLLTPLTAMEKLEVTPNKALADLAPEVRYINPRKTTIYCNRNYQRELDAADMAFLLEIGEGFDWGRFKVPNCYEGPDGALHCTDGQKTILAAMFHDLTIPVLVLRVPPEESLARQADSFVGLNTVQRRAKALDIFAALYCRGDSEEVEFAKILKKHNIQPVRINSGLPSGGKTQPCQTICINVLRAMHKDHGKTGFDTMCKLFSLIGYRPIQRIHIYAFNIIFARMEPTEIDLDRMRNAVLSIIDKHALLEAKENVRNSKRKTTPSAELANIYMARYSKKLRALNAN